MLAPFFIDMLVGCLLLILAGWVSDEIRAGRRDVESMRPPGWNQMSRPRKPWQSDDPDATWIARPVRRQF
jgi:hypothetical protein